MSDTDTPKVKLKIYGNTIVADLAVPHSLLRSTGYTSKTLVALAIWLTTVRYVDDWADYISDVWHIKICGSIVGIMQYRRQLIEELSRDTPYKCKWVIDVKRVSEKELALTRLFYDEFGISLFHTDYEKILSPYS